MKRTVSFQVDNHRFSLTFSSTTTYTNGGTEYDSTCSPDEIHLYFAQLSEHLYRECYGEAQLYAKAEAEVIEPKPASGVGKDENDDNY